MPCILKSKRPFHSRQISFCGKVVSGGGVHFKHITEAKKSKKPICSDCLDALGLTKQKLRPRKKTPTYKKRKTQKTPKKLAKATKIPIVPKFDRKLVLENKELFIGCSIILLREQKRLPDFLASNVNSEIAIDYFYYRKNAQSIANDINSTKNSIPTRARTGLVQLSEEIEVNPLELSTWPISALWEIKRYALSIAIEE